MTNRRFTVLTFAAVALATVLAPADASAQSIWDRIRDRAEQERQRDVDRLLDNSRYNGSNREDRINNEARDLRNAANRFRNVAGDNDRLDRSRDEARELLQAASQFSRMLNRLRLDSRTSNDWNQIRSDLRTVANIYNLRFNDDRGYNIYNGNDRRDNRRWE
jgi:DNA mismatch repair ATPase MutS